MKKLPTEQHNKRGQTSSHVVRLRAEARGVCRVLSITQTRNLSTLMRRTPQSDAAWIHTPSLTTRGHVLPPAPSRRLKNRKKKNAERDPTKRYDAQNQNKKHYWPTSQVVRLYVRRISPGLPRAFHLANANPLHVSTARTDATKRCDLVICLPVSLTCSHLCSLFAGARSKLDTVGAGSCCPLRLAPPLSCV